MRRVHLRIHGNVQGVSFRYYSQQRALRNGLTGWVRNCADGTVEMVVQGADDAVQQFIAWAHEGPSAAHVEGVDIDEEQPGYDDQLFLVR